MTEKYYGKPLGIPIVGVGSQPAEEGDETFSFMGAPGAMPTFQNPILPEPEEVENLVAAKTLLAQMQQGIEQYQAHSPALKYDLMPLDAANLDLVNQVLNEGEVSVVYSGVPTVQIQESVLTGVWRVQTFDAHQQLIADCIEVAEIPSIVRERGFANVQALDTNLNNLPFGVLNAPALMTEVAEKSASWETGALPHVINLSLLPLSPEDLAFLGERLGVGEVTILSRGYGNCRIGSTRIPNVWWVKYYNSEDALILNSIEIVDVPAVACAAPEDLADSAERLAEILEVYQ
ncbi:hydrogenase expression/formation protein [uncultured Thiothrix sp.]|uniref:hydrogenase expression/formation protein n=1 Tax=uncultured Thiothrix sp. TaxID=223185 RepID=UPI00260BB3F5|nr:hydrogenase expression/formation protein [uncultured Thiothrix sp.]